MHVIINLVAIFVYLAILIFIGAYAYRKMPSLEPEEYMVAGRKLGIFAGLMTFGASQWSALSFMGFMVFFFLDGTAGLVGIWGMYILLTGILWMVYAPRVWDLGRKLGHITPADHVRDWYNSRYLGYITAACLILAILPYLQIQLTGASYVLQVATGGQIGFWLGAILIYGVILVYIWGAGMRGVAWTDVFQGLLFICLGVIIGVWILQFAGGWGAFSQLAVDKPALFSMPGPRGVWSAAFAWSWAIPVGFGWVFHPHMWIRQHSIRSKKITYLFPLFMIACWTSVVLIMGYFTGMSANLLIPGFGQPDKVLLHSIQKFLPWPVLTITAPAAVAAMMSSVGSQAHGIGTSITNDFASRLKPDLSDIQLVYVARITITICLALGLVLQAVYPELLVRLGGITAAIGVQAMPITIPPLFAKGKEVTKEGAIVSILAGEVWLFITQFVYNPIPMLYPGFQGLIVGFVALGVVSLFTPGTPSKETVEKYNDALEVV